MAPPKSAGGGGADGLGDVVLAAHQHGKSRVRLGRVWREAGGQHHFVEWRVATMLESDMEAAFLAGDNTGMTATDTQKNAVYLVAQRCGQRCAPEAYALALAAFFLEAYPRVSAAKVWVDAAPWARASVGGAPHAHGFAEAGGAETRTVAVIARRGGGPPTVTAGVAGLKLLKTTQSGYEGFLRDPLTTLPESRDRIMASSVTAHWRYAPGAPPACFDAAHAAARAALAAAFLGPAAAGVYSPSVQFTLHRMAAAALAAVPAAQSIYINAPNLHFLPVAPVGSAFRDDVYAATSEPHGNIEAVVTRAGAAPHCRL